jgi:flagella basal body P-ring formation protein FlgA
MKRRRFILIILTLVAVHLSLLGISYAGNGKKILGERYLRMIFKDFVCRQTSSSEDDVIISRFRAYGKLNVPDGTVQYNIFRKNRGPLAGLVRLVMIVKVDGIPMSRIQMAGWVDIFRNVVCAARNIKRGHIITRDDIYLDRRNISRISDKVITQMDKVIGMVAKHNIREDISLKEWMIERPAIVKKGDIVTIVAQKGPLKITVPGRVLEKGFSGDVIRVENVMSRKEIFAKVVNNKTVMVEF